MRREIKFRLWDNEFKIFTDYHLIKALVIDINRYERFIFDQYTGLTDKNGVELYENDIVVKESYGRRSKPMKVEYVGHVIEPFNYGNENHETILPSDCIVIGNIHQNSDLLK